MLSKAVLSAFLSVIILLAFSSAHVSAKDGLVMTAYKTREDITVDGFPGEGFWSRIPETRLVLKPSDEYGGAVKEVFVKAAHNGSWIYLFTRWPDDTESRRTDPVVRKATGGYIYNSTYYYGDIIWTVWSMIDGGSTKPPVDAYAHTRFAGTPGSGKPGLVANLWSWRSYNEGDGPTFPYHYFPPSTYAWGPKAGQPLIFPYSFAYDSYLNASAQYNVGTGLMRVQVCAAPLDDLDPFPVRAKGNWGGHYWTTELARPFTSPSSTSNRLFDIQLAEGQSYWVAFAVADGNKGEVYSTNSISEWVRLEISPRYTYMEQEVLDAKKAVQDTQYISYAAVGASSMVAVAVAYLAMRKRIEVKQP